MQYTDAILHTKVKKPESQVKLNLAIYFYPVYQKKSPLQHEFSINSYQGEFCLFFFFK